MALKVIAWNCQSVRNKTLELSRFIEKNKVDIFTLSETWLLEKDSIHFPSFDCYRVNRFHGGVAIFIKNSISHTFFRQISLDFAEALFVKIHETNGDFALGAIYCSPAATRTKAHDFFSQSLSITGRCIIAGDFNAKHQRWNSNKICRKGSDLVKLCDSRLFKIHGPDGPTLIPTRGNPSTVDFVVSKAMTGVSDPCTVNELSSDHFPLAFSITCDAQSLKKLQNFNFSKANWKKFRQLTEVSAYDVRLEFPLLDCPQQIDECLSMIFHRICIATDQSVPKKNLFRRRHAYNQEIHT